MTGHLEFSLKLKDMLSGGLGKISGNAQAAFGKVDRVLAGTQNKLDGLNKIAGGIGNSFGNSANSAVNSLNSIGNAARNAERDMMRLDRVAKGGSAGGGNSFLKMAGAMGVGNLAAQAATAAGRFAFEQGKSVIDLGMESNKNRAQFNILAGGQKEGSSLYKDLSKYIQESVFGPELYDQAKSLMSYGVAAKDILPDLKMLGDIAGGDAEKMKLLSYAFAQTTSAGKLVGNDLMQYTGAGFNPLEVISKHTGRSMANLMKDKESGNISAAMVKQAMIWDTGLGGRHFGMLDAMNKSASGKTQAMLGNVDMAKMALGESLLPAYTSILDKLQPIVDKLPDALGKLVPYGEKMADAFTEMLPDMIAFGKSMGKDLKPVVDLMLSPEMKNLGKNVLAFGKTILDDLQPAIKDLSTAATKMAGSVNWFIDLLPGHKSGSMAGIPDWGGSLPNSRNIMHLGRQPERQQLRDYIKNNFGGVEPWMNDEKERLSWLKTHHFTRPGKLPLGFGSMWSIDPLGTLKQNDKTLSYLQKGIGINPPPDTRKNKLNNENIDPASSISDSIIGGGKKQLTINIHNVVGNINNNPASTGEAVKMMENDVEGIVARFLAMAAEM